MRNNVVLFGIPEHRGEDCTKKAIQLFKEVIKIEHASDLKIDRAHRTGDVNHDDNIIRPIVVAFQNFKQRELVRQASFDKFTDTNFGLAEQFPREIVIRRKILKTIIKEIKKVVILCLCDYVYEPRVNGIYRGMGLVDLYIQQYICKSNLFVKM